MLTQAQNQIIYLMFLNGLLFLGLNFIAYSIVFPGPKGPKRIGYMFISCGLLAYLVQQIYQGMIALDYPQENVSGLILSGLVIPVFFVSIFYYRIKRNRIEKEQQSKIKGRMIDLRSDTFTYPTKSMLDAMERLKLETMSFKRILPSRNLKT
ncbi:MAG: hypothetical protein Ct9H300mP23_02710 [Nitrospinota bacterium]|nr:MAG: hypothetical protein Ct9H300mP23_02710 [Nitrospinota bacterium]